MEALAIVTGLVSIVLITLLFVMTSTLDSIKKEVRGLREEVAFQARLSREVGNDGSH